MDGIWKSLTGQAEKERRERNRKFKAAIPDTYPADMTVEERAAIHPAYSGDMANSLQAENYRRAHYMHGPQSKAEHAAFARQQALMEEYERQVANAAESERVLSFGQWLKEQS
jgi:hypothetical protein